LRIALERQCRFPFLFVYTLGSSAFAAAGTGGGQPCSGAFTNQVTLKLGQRSEEMKD
jgi:hypothetical protein